MTPDKNQWWTEKTEKWIYKWECRKKRIKQDRESEIKNRKKSQ